MKKLQLLYTAVVTLIVSALASFGAFAKEKAYYALTLLTYRTGLVAYADGPFSPYKFPSVRDLDAYKVQNPDTVQIVRQSLYDTVLYPTAGATQISLFTQPKGQGQTMSPGAVAGVAKNDYDTNMVIAGQLPRFQQFVVESIELYFLPGSVNTANLFAQTKPATYTLAAAQTLMESVNDVNGFYQTGYLKLVVSNGDLLTEAPLRKFPPKADVGIDAALATNSGTVGQIQAMWASAKGRPYMLQPLITLQDNAQFAITLNWPNVFATPSGFNGQVRCVLDGYMIRATQ